MFPDALPNCLIWRYELGNLSHNTSWARIGQGDDLARSLAHPVWQLRHFAECAGHLLFSRHEYAISLQAVASVKVGAVSGADAIYASEEAGTLDFVTSSTGRSGRTRRMIWCEPGEPPPAPLVPYKERLIARRIRRYDETNWWQWGRGYYQSDLPRVYVNGKTRRPEPFFVHDCPHYDGSVLAIFPRNPTIDVRALASALNRVDWEDLGFICDGRFLFTQRSLEQTLLPGTFRPFLPESGKSWWEKLKELI